ncbi:2-hydroxyacid dehydrogenase [Pelagibius sp. Alg239-R121]|uniref:2-hydroxyacid dehydrogenase n=1 Tax=Pelagibius sp. Alg239-R121 TaxID=2993448 RepID=UPI0024A65570|nr:2-hydroxyacid dehydrogenase [Pelagibius sp. Alg239-R121]
MSKPQVLVIGPYPQWDMDALDARFSLHRLWEATDQDALFAAHADSIRAVATRGDLGADAALMKRLPNLEMISCFGVGVDGIDLEYARSASIKVANTPDVLTDDVADMGVALLLAAARRIPQGDVHVRSGAWLENAMGLTSRVSGKRLGVLGMGRIGAALAKRMRGFDMTIAYHNRSRRDDIDAAYMESPQALAAASDFLVITTAGGDGTRHIVDGSVLEALGPEGVLVNISRGSTVDEEALIDALAQRRIGGAGLDVFAAEPDMDRRLLDFENVVVQPHHASGTVETRKAMGKLVLDNLIAHFDGVDLLTPVV